MSLALVEATSRPLGAPASDTLHGLVIARAKRSPETVAVRSGEERLSYGELDARSARLASRLRRLGVAPGSLVGLAVERSVEMVVGILGTLRAGGAYVPLDPDYPAERLAFMWRDCGARVLLAQDRLLRAGAGRVPGAGRVVLLDRPEAGAPSPLRHRAAKRRDRGKVEAAGGAGPEDLAYVIYTSGSTGKPKGVMIEHRAVVNLVRENARLLRVGAASRVLQLASLSFDASVLEIFTALSTGAELVLTGRETLLSGEVLGEELRRQRITTLAIPPSLLDKVPEGVELPDLAGIVVGGETCSAATAERWAPGRRFFNAYAPTEATIYITAHECRPPFSGPGGALPPIGRAVAGGVVHVLGPALRPGAGSEAGELCLGGPGLARGYLRRPALTAERFVPDPLPELPGARLYRSGDLGRRLPDGTLAFLGRADLQVKVRGVRIELGEIESTIAGLAGVQGAVVEARDGAAGEKRLVAYVVPRAGEEPTAGGLRDALAAVLPAALVPQSFVLLPELPRTPTGKVDRRALPDPGGERPELATGYAPPRTPVEERLAALWGELLGLDRVGIHDDLFALGGHSLVASQIASRVRRDLGRELPLMEVFERPTVAGLAGYLEGEAGGAEAEPELPAIEPLPPEERRRPLPVTFPQERVWFLLQLAPGAIAYNFQFTIRFRGALHAPALARALSEVVRRHEVLRTTFPELDGRPVQRVRDPFPVELPVIDLTCLPGARREAQSARLVRRLIRRSFDVERLPLFRTYLLRLAAEDHVFLQVEHHFVHDGWSLAVYLKEIRELYRAYRRPGGEGAPSPLPELAVQYGDFAVWQRRLLDGELFRRQLAYWAGQLGGSPPLLELPADRPRPRVHGFRGGALRVDLPPALYQASRAFGPRHGATLFMTMLAAFDALLYHYTGQEDLVIGSGVGNRRHREVEDLVGMVVNTVVLRTRLGAGLRFRELLERVRRTTLEAHLHQDMPFERLVQELQPERDLSRNPIFQVLFSFHDAPVPDLDLPGLSGELFEPHNGSAKAELNVVAKPLAEQRVGRRRTGLEALTMVWEYSAEIFDRATVERMWGHYRTLLAGAVEAPDRPLADLPLLCAAESHQLLAEWNDTAVAYPRERSIAELFSERARLRPEAIAVRQGERWWSYGELEARSDRLASRLVDLGVGPEALVGLAAERSPELVAGLLGILKAGGAYLPLDAAYPPERLAFMLEDGRVPVLLAADEFPAKLPAPALERRGTRVVPLAEALAAGEEEAPKLGARSGPSSLAYVLYTSGSTGRPKGVAVEQRSVVRLVRGASFAAMGQDEVFLQLAPVPFDASTLEIWGALLNGARLEVFPPGAPSLEELGRCLESSRVTTLWLTAGLFHRMVEEELPCLAGVRQLLAGGDVLSVPHVERTLAALGTGQVLVNGYGPTEGTTFTCCHRMPPGGGVRRESVPIGRPVSSTRIYLAAPGPGLGIARGSGRVPVGVPGELYVGGDGVARGYLARPALTAERFVPDPFSSLAGARLYRTGDLARRLPDGEVEFLGRIDRQVKLRGFRIEPAEIESVLAGHPAVRAAAVVVREDRAGDRRLVAYAVPGDGGAVEPPALRAYLAARLPDYMVPSDWVILEELPLDPNGKVDRRALLREEPWPDAEAGRRIAGFVPPRGPVEELVAGIWAEVLGRGTVGAHDDFFELGGHSLAATSVVSRLRRVFGVEVPVRTLFEEPTVAGLTARLAAPRDEAAPVEEARPVRRLPRDRELPASFAQERMWFLDRFEADRSVYHVPAPVRIRGRLDPAFLAAALRALEERHEGLRTRFAEGSSAEAPVLQVVRPPGRRPEGAILPVLDLQALAPGRRDLELGRLALAEVRRPFDLAREPLWHFCLARHGPEDHAFLVTAHHAVTDGWSVGVFFRELWELYSARAAGRSPRLPELRVQYPDFAVWQRSRLRGPVLDREVGWWRERLAGVPPVLELPADRPRPAARSGRGGRLRAVLAPSLSDRLRELANRERASLFMVLLGALQAWLCRLSGQDDVAVGTPIANRTRSEIEGLIGLFVNTLVLRTDLSGDLRFDELLGRVRRVAFDAYAHQDLPFEKLVEAIEPERRLEHTPLFQVSLVLQNAAPPATPPPGLEVEPLPVEAPTAKFDLSFSFEETPRGLLVRIAYSRDLFDATTVRRMLRQLGTLLAAAAEEPAAKLSSLPLLAPVEAQALREWNEPPAPARSIPAVTVRGAFLAWVERTPDAVALEFCEERWSYRGLAGWSGALARRLRGLGVGPEARVALLLEPSAGMIAAVLGVHRAGGAYVPLDPASPPERLRFLLEDSGAVAVVTDRSSAGLPPLDRLEGRIVRLGEGAEALVEPGDEPAPQVSGRHLAYQIYTSGSTGRPKGVAVEHRHLLSYVRAVTAHLGLDPGAALATVSPLTADLGNTSVFPALAGGARVVVVPREAASDPEGLAACAARHRYDLLKMVPSHWSALVSGAGWKRMLPARWLVLAGEALPQDLARRAAGAGCRVANHYGPTETTVAVLVHPYGAAMPDAAPASVPLGRPLAGCRVHVLDPGLRPVPIGAAGEIAVGGSSVSRGYPGRPGRTAAVFVPDPWAGEACGRLYRTGDLARRLPGGEVEFLRRIDGQVKVRGYRVEPGEVESWLLAHPGVREAAVVLGGPGGPGAEGRLVACFAEAPGARVSVSELRRHLAEHLPEPLVPSGFIRLEELPRLRNGKVDRRSLAAAGAFAPGPDGGSVAPRSPLEELVAEVWGEVLGRQGVGAYDGFFDLGGHSLLAIRVVSRLRRLTGVELPLRALFEQPTVAGQARELERALAGEEGAGEAPEEPPLLPLPRDRELPASFAQERMWFLGRYGENRSLYNLPTPYRLRGGVEAPALARALAAVVARHEALRTLFRPARGSDAAVAQRILPRLAVALPVADLRALPAARRGPEAERLAVVESEEPFDLDRGPLLRAALLRLGRLEGDEEAEEDALLLTVHHIVSDAWSTGVLLRELLAVYAAFRRGRRPRLPELPVQYADFAAWQRRWLSGAALERQLAFWRAELAGAPGLLELPTDRPRPALQGFRGDRRDRRLPADLFHRLRALARDHGASLFMVLLAAFQALLARLAGQTDLTVGVPVANRNREETEGLVGFFVNALVVRADLSGDPPFADLVGETRRRTLAAYAHQDLPFEKLVEALRPKRELSHTPLFQVVLNFHDARRLDLFLPEGVDLELTPLTPRWRTAKFDLVLNALEDPAGLRLRLEHALHLFDRTTAERLLRHLETLLGEAAAHPGRRLSELGLLAAAERHQVLAEWNDTAAADLVDPAAALLHAPFERRAAERPDAVAVVAGGREHLSYGELERRAGGIARRLAASGVGPGTLVGVHLGRSPAMAAAVLGVAKAGGAYVPLETGWPSERIRWIVAERGVRHLVTETSRLGAAAALGETLDRVISADEDSPQVPGGPRPRPAGPGDLAYVIFTSGSTGKPKGVMVRHRPAAHLVSWVNRTFGVGPDDRLLFVTALSFDLSVYDLFGTLAAGATVRLATEEELADPVRQVEVLAAERITFWDSAPAALQRLAPLFPAGEGQSGAAALRLVFLSGDWVPLTLPGRVRRCFPGARVVALGGATEATVWSNSFPVEEVSDAWASIPYGRPIANARYHVLDGRLAPCPIGVAGDLYITGECLSSGYAGSPAQTAESYLPHPFAAGAGGRSGDLLYRTGDRARYFPDGNLEFLGRLDTQVKVRGFRIELGEIEAVLMEHPGVSEAVVLAREDSPGDRRLAAYWIPAEGEPAPGPRELRRWAAGRLPEYMVPVAWIERRDWPLSPTGKLDRKALPAPGEAAGGAADEPDGGEAAAEPPRTALERAVAAVWQDALGVPSVARDANFFDLGGHSLLLARVHERLEGALRRELPMVELFRNPTVATLAAALSEGGVAPIAEEERPRRRPAGGGEVAVVGLAGRFPGARDVDELWRNLRAGVESIRFFGDDELAAAGFDPAELRDPALVKARAVLDDPDLFDADFFGYSPREAEAIDPQQRLFLECAWQALEDAGHAPPAAGRGARVGVFGGGSATDYLRRVEAHPELPRLLGAHQVAISNHPDYLPTRVSYKLRLTGPSVAVQTACSTSLVAVHLACRSLLDGECDLALAGGASLRGRQVAPYRYVEGGISSPDGHVRAFDAGARGVVGGSGVGVVALRRLEDALADGDAIRAVIRGTAINNDGGLKAGFTAPSAEGQAEAIREALAAAGVDPATVGYVEAHGTATPLGDPIEVEGLTRAFGGAAAGGRTCALGSIKTNIGHLDAAAGIAGLIKAVLALEHREIPPSLHFETPNPAIDFAAGPFFVADRLILWPAGTHPRRAGVSSFGIGGTNAHAVLEEAPAPEEDGSAGAAPAGGRSAELVVLSARSEAALERSTAELARHLRERPEVPLADAAWTLQAGRRAFPWRRAVVASSRTGRGGEAAVALETLDRRLSRTGPAPDEAPRVAFLFPGQGAQFPGMGEALYREEPVFRAALDRCAELLEPELGADPRELLFQDSTIPREEAEERLARTELTQPLLFAVEHALGELWASWGVAPAALLGHSLGEYAAAARAGVFALEDALRLVAARGRLMGSRPGGAMLGVRLSEEGLAPYLEADGSLALAAVNAPDACAISGPADAVAALRERLEAAGVGCRSVHASHAFHSSRMDAVVEPFRELVARVELRPPRIPFLSNVTGTWIAAEEATDPGYWARQLRSPVRFADGLAALVGGSEESAAGWALVEVGPGRTLTTLARRHPAAAGTRALVQSTRHPRQEGTDLDRVLAALGSLWVAGVEVDWAAHHGERRRRRVRLPTYPFERRSYWVGDDLPRRAGDPAPAPPEPAGPTEAGAPSEAEAAVARAFHDLLGVEADGREADFFELGGSSLLALQLAGRLRELSGVELPSDALLQASTVGELAALVEERRSAAAAGEAPAAASCLVPLRRTGSRRPLFLVHQVGGHVYSFRSLVHALPADQPVYGLRSRGLEPGEQTLPTVEAMAAHYLELVRGVQPRGPYRLGGASMGGMVAFEMAGRVLDEGEEVELLTLMDTPCGDQMPPKPEDDAVLVAAAFAGRANLDPEELRALEPDERLRVGLDRARESGRLGEGFDLEQARRLVTVLSANVEALYGYEPRPYPGRIVLFRARELRPDQRHRPERAWVCLAEGGIDVTFVPGDHETMHEAPGAAAMAAHLEPLLAAAAPPGAGAVTGCAADPFTKGAPCPCADPSLP